MNIKYTKGGQLYELQGVETIWLELDNHNEITMFEVESGMLHLENSTDLHLPGTELGLMIFPQTLTTVHIIPEG